MRESEERVEAESILLLPHQRGLAGLKLPCRNVGALLTARASAAPDKTFLIEPHISNVSFTYSEMLAQITQREAKFAEVGLGKGDAVNLLIPNSAAFITLYFAALYRGIVVVPINPNLAPAEMEYIIHDSRSKLAIYDKSLQKKVEGVQEINRGSVAFIDADDFWRDASPEQAAAAREHVDLYDRSVIIYTSGTTGNPKGVVLNHLNLLADAQAISEWFHFDAEVRTLCILPLFHNNGQVVTLLAPLFAGGSTVIVSAQTGLLPFWDLVDSFGIAWTSVMPSILTILMQNRQEVHNRHLKGIICGGQVLKRSVQESFEQRFNVPVFEGFGLTETTSFACFNSYPAEKRLVGSIGKPLPVNEMMLIDEHDAAIERPYQEGEICIRGFNVAVEYLGLPDRNLVSFRNGWFHSGDKGYRDESGNYYFLCRNDDLIISGGENIYPAEIENVLLKNEWINECAVIGVEHPVLGEQVCAFVDAANAELTANDIRAFCSGKLAFFKQPKLIFLLKDLEGMNEIPKGPTKKVLYRVLKDYYSTHLSR